MSQNHRQFFIFFVSLSTDNRSWSVSPVSTTDHIDTSVRPFIQEKILTARGSSKALVLTHGGSRVNKLQAKTKCQILQHQHYNTLNSLKQFWKKLGLQLNNSHQLISGQYSINTPEAAPGRWSVQNVFLKISQNSQEITYIRVSFSIKSQAKACNFIKKETLAKTFSWEFCEIFKNTYF